MQRLLALHWNQSEASAIIASLRGSRVVVERAFSISLREEAAGGDAAEGSAAERLPAELKSQRVGRLDTIVAMGRESVELRHLTLPAAPDEELPDLVRFQALRQFNNLEEQWPLDYVPLNAEGDASRYVFAAAVRSELVETVRQTCDAAGVKLVRLVLRPCAAAALVARRLGDRAAAARIVVNIEAEEVDLAVMVDERITFLRQTRLPGDPLTDPAQAPALAVELRRTMAAAQNQPGSRPVESVVLLGAGDRYGPLAAAISEDLHLPSEVVDPFSGVEWEDRSAGDRPESLRRFAPLVGAAWEEATSTRPAFDFLNPRRRPEPPSRRNTYALAGLAAGLLVLAVMAVSWLKGDRLEAEIRRLQANSRALDKNFETAEKTEKAAQEIEQWISGEVDWLDELRWLSEHFPQAEDAMLTQIKLNVNSGRGEITLDGVARNVESVAELDRGLHDERHRLAGKSKSESDVKPPYGVQFRSSVRIERGE